MPDVKFTEKVKVDVADLKLGMYVSELDRPWVGSPFLLQGFLINDTKDLEKIQRLCKYVYVDSHRSMKTVIEEYQKGPKSGGNEWSRKVVLQGKERSIQMLDINLPTEAKAILGKGGNIADLPQPQPTVDIRDELPKARQIFDRLKREMTRLYDAVDNNKEAVFLPLLGLSIDVVSSIRRNEDALQWHVVTNPDDKTESRHAMNVCIMAVKLGNYIGLPDRHMRQLALAGLTYDIGKLIISDEIRKKSGKLTEAEMNVMQKHVKVGAEILDEIGDIVPPEAANVCRRHHERLDGSGYPEGLKGESIDLLSRIIAIIDTYDAITSAGHYSQGKAASHAMDILYKERNTAFDADLVAAFIKCNGIYPVGTLVETQTGEVGIVVSNNVRQKLSPSVIVVLDNNKVRLPDPPIVDFATEKDSSGRLRYNIKKALHAGNYGVDPRDFLTG